MTPSSLVAFACIISGLLLIAPIHGYGQGAKESATSQPEEKKRTPSLRTFMIYFENDVFAGTDQHYTNALKLTWLTKDIDRYDEVLPTWTAPATERVPFAGQAKPEEKVTHNIGFSIGQNIYTPDDIEKEDLIEDDRPYAGWLYGSIALHRKTTKRLDTFEVTGGMVGPSAYGEEVQNTVHRYGDSQHAGGWDHQLRDEPGIMLSWQQSRKAVLLDWGGMGFDLIPHYGATLGNVFTYANLGGEARLGINLPTDFGTSLIRPGSTLSAPIGPNGGNSGFGVHLFAGADGRAILRNIFLDGNTWKDSHEVDKKYFVADIYSGLALSYNRFKLSYTHAYRTKEFDGQNRGQYFGSIHLRYSF